MWPLITYLLTGWPSNRVDVARILSVRQPAFVCDRGGLHTSFSAFTALLTGCQHASRTCFSQGANTHHLLPIRCQHSSHACSQGANTHHIRAHRAPTLITCSLTGWQRSSHACSQGAPILTADDMAAAISGTPHSLGYVQSSLGVTAGLVEANLMNRDGVVQKSPAASAQAAILVSTHACHSLIHCTPGFLVGDECLASNTTLRAKNQRPDPPGPASPGGNPRSKTWPDIAPNTTRVARLVQTRLTSNVSSVDLSPESHPQRGPLCVPHVLQRRRRCRRQLFQGP